MQRTLGRRTIFARSEVRSPPPRPPWAVAEGTFTERCSGCGDCIRACPQSILVAGRGRLPVIDFARGGCTFCGACADACAVSCFEPSPREAAWSNRATASSDCIEMQGVMCRACEAACETDAIRFRPRIGGGSTITIAAETCTGCGACVSRCPASAIAVAPNQIQGVAA